MVNVLTIRTICVVVTALWAPVCVWAQVAPANAPVIEEKSASNMPTAAGTAKSGALASYQPYVDAPVSPWRETNDRVRAVGGWKAYAREVQSGDAAAPETRP